MKYKAWQIGWEQELYEVECDPDDPDDCPACALAGLPPEGVSNVDPIVIAFQKAGSKDVRYHTVTFVIAGPLVARTCMTSTDADLEHARYCARQARLGKVEHWFAGQRVLGGEV